MSSSYGFGPGSNSSLWQTLSRQGKGFTFVTGPLVVPTTAETDFMLMRNPSASGVLIRLKDIFMTMVGAASQVSLFRFYRLPTITSDGTPITIFKVLPTGTQAAQALAFSSPVISNRGTLIQLFSVPFTTLTRDQDLGRYIASGTDLLLTIQGTTTNLQNNVAMVWVEE